MRAESFVSDDINHQDFLRNVDRTVANSLVERESANPRRNDDPDYVASEMADTTSTLSDDVRPAPAARISELPDASVTSEAPTLGRSHAAESLPRSSMSSVPTESQFVDFTSASQQRDTVRRTDKTRIGEMVDLEKARTALETSISEDERRYMTTMTRFADTCILFTNSLIDMGQNLVELMRKREEREQEIWEYEKRHRMSPSHSSCTCFLLLYVDEASQPSVDPGDSITPRIAEV